MITKNKLQDKLKYINMFKECNFLISVNGYPMSTQNEIIFDGKEVSALTKSCISIVIDIHVNSTFEFHELQVHISTSLERIYMWRVIQSVHLRYFHYWQVLVIYLPFMLH